jgi:hypothetical protein
MPRLAVKTVCRGPGSDRIRLEVKLEGPDGLDRLDKVGVSIRDDRHRVPMIEGGQTQEQINETIWGPYRFVPGVDGADRLGRSVPPFPLARGESRSLGMQPSLAPSWVGVPGQWQLDYATEPIRLEITCAREGDPPWRIPKELDQPQPRLATVIKVHQEHHAVTVTARNVGTAPARKVSFRSSDPAVVVEGDETSLLEVGSTTSSMIFLMAESTTTWVELAWTDQLGIARRQRVELE